MKSVKVETPSFSTSRLRHLSRMVYVLGNFVKKNNRLVAVYSRSGNEAFRWQNQFCTKKLTKEFYVTFVFGIIFYDVHLGFLAFSQILHTRNIVLYLSICRLHANCLHAFYSPFVAACFERSHEFFSVFPLSAMKQISN